LYLREADPLDLRGVRVGPSLLAEILLVLRSGSGGFNRRVRFDSAQFTSNALISAIQFNRPVSFAAATFEKRVTFSGVVFSMLTRFDQAVFAAPTEDELDSNPALPTRFLDCQFLGRTRFTGARFAGTATFARSTFAQHANFGDAVFKGDVRFDRTTFERNRSLELLDIAGRCHFDYATFERFVTISLGAELLNCGATQFRDGVNLRISRGDVVLEHSDLGLASTISRYREAGIESRRDSREAAPSSDSPDSVVTSPRLVSLRGSSLRTVEVADLDLRPCLFGGVTGLEGLHLSSTVRLGLPPSRRSRRQLRAWTPREVIAEERLWRSADGRWSEWTASPEYCAPDVLKGVEALAPFEIADIYRSLRKGREDKRDEPGAEDFYYGEMEMRRHSTKAQRRPRSRASEHAIIWAFWATSGYGLRPLRATVALLGVVASFSALIATVGQTAQHNYGDALLNTLNAATLRGGSDSGLTETGRWLQLPLRLLGPLLFALILLSLRGRVKR
jgi:hypothetical protein